MKNKNLAQSISYQNLKESDSSASKPQGKSENSGFPRPLITNAIPEDMETYRIGRIPTVEDLIELQNLKFDTLVSMMMDLSAKFDLLIKSK